MNIKLIICDWEGCISEPGGGIVPWPTENIAELSRVVNLMRSEEKYPPLVLCSGRQFPYGEAALQAINAFWDGMPSILENGVGLYYPKTKSILWNPAITGSTSEAMTEIRVKVSREMERLDLNKEVGKEYCISLNPPADMAIEWLYDYMANEFKDYQDLVEITHSRSAVDITPKGVDKGSGVRFLSEVTGIALEDVVGIGDTKGDLPMLNLVGHPAVPANADESVRRIAEYVSAFDTTKGVIDIICHYTGIDSKSL
jgi:hydroxymethylpyrimidine pyrophosphatase-like HAD family hydrolase